MDHELLNVLDENVVQQAVFFANSCHFIVLLSIKVSVERLM